MSAPKTFDTIYQMLDQADLQVIAVAAAEDEDVLHAIREAIKLKIAKVILCGNEKKIREIAEKIQFDLDGTEVIDCPDTTASAKKAVECVHNGKASVLMKGLLETSTFMKAVIDRENGLRIPGNIISAVAAVEFPEADRIIGLHPAGQTNKKTPSRRITANYAVLLRISKGVRPFFKLILSKL